jgi:hypothetical protein
LSNEAEARSARIEPLLSTVMRGLNRRIHLLAKMMDCRVEPGNDNRFNTTGARPGAITVVPQATAWSARLNAREAGQVQ